jgi:hypothetical protein
MKHWLKAMVVGSGMLAACDSPTDNDVVRFDLVTYLGAPLPVEIGMPGDEASVCVDSIYAGFVELISGVNARAVTNRVRNCSGQRTIEDGERSGTFETRGDTIRFTWRIDNPQIAFFSEEALSAGDQLRFVQRVYTEADPDGSGQTFVSAVYQRR